jgi:hypothetical protein
VTNIEDAVNEVFSRLAAGELTQTAALFEDGWETTLPSGRVVVRSTLQAEAASLIALGPKAVPYLQAWTTNANRALRYVATHALETISRSPK